MATTVNARDVFIQAAPRLVPFVSTKPSVSPDIIASEWVMLGATSGAQFIVDASAGEEFQAIRSATATPLKIFSKEFLVVDPSKNYRIRVRAKQSAAGATNNYLSVAWYDKDFVNITGTAAAPGGTGWANSTYSSISLTGGNLATTYTQYTAAFGPSEAALLPAGIKYMRIGMQLNTNSVAGVYCSFRGLDISEKVATTAIVPGAVDTQAFSSGIEPLTVVSFSPGSPPALTTQSIFNTTDRKIWRWNGSTYIVTTETSDLNGTLLAANFSNTLRPVEVVNTLPPTGNFQGRTVLLTTDDKLYRHNGTSFIKAVDGADITANTITGNSIVAGTITTGLLAAESITASKLLVADNSNAYPDYDFNDTSYYSTPNSATYGFNPATAGSLGAKYLYISDNASQRTVRSGWFPIEVSTEYYVGATTYTGASSSGVTAVAYIEFATIDSGGVITASGVENVISSATDTNNSPSRTSIVISSGSTDKRARVIVKRSAGGTGEAKFGGFRVQRRNAGNLIVDGSIDTLQLTAGAVTADKIEANAVTANKIEAGSIYTRHLVLGDTSNMFPDPDLKDSTMYGGSGFTLEAVAVDGGPSVNQLVIGSAAAQVDVTSARFLIDPGKYYQVTCYMETGASGTGTAEAWIRFFSDVNASSAATGGTTPVQIGTYSTNVPIRKVIQVQAPTDAKSAKILFRKTAGDAGSPFGRTAIFSAPTVRQAANAELIVNNGLTIKNAAGTVLLEAGGTSNVPWVKYAENSTATGAALVEETITSSNTALLRKLAGGTNIDITEGVGVVTITGINPVDHIYLSADQAFTSTTLADVTNFSMTIAANTTYLFRGTLFVKSDTSTTGIYIGSSGSSTSTIAFNATAQTNTSGVPETRGCYTTTGAALGVTFTSNVYPATPTGHSNTAYGLVKIEAIVKTGGTAGSFQIMAAIETAGATITVGAGSYLEQIKMTNATPTVTPALATSTMAATYTTDAEVTTGVQTSRTIVLTIKTDGTWTITTYGGSGGTADTGTPTSASWKSAGNADNFDVKFTATSTTGTTNIIRTNNASSYKQLTTDLTYSILATAPASTDITYSGSSTVEISFRNHNTGSVFTLFDTVTLTTSALSINPL